MRINLILAPAIVLLSLSACGSDSDAQNGTPVGETVTVTYNETPFEITLESIECGLTEASKESRVIVIGQPEDKIETETFETAPGNQYCRYEVTATNLGDAPAWAQYIRQAEVNGKTYDNHDTNDLNAVSDGPPPWESLQPGQSATITQWLELPEGEVDALIYPPGDDGETIRLLTK